MTPVCDLNQAEFHTMDLRPSRSTDPTGCFFGMTSFFFPLRSCYGRKAQRQESQSKKKSGQTEDVTGKIWTPETDC